MISWVILTATLYVHVLCERATPWSTHTHSTDKNDLWTVLHVFVTILWLYLTFRNLRLWTYTQLVHVLTFLILVLSWQFEWGILGCFYQLESYHISYQAVRWLFWLLVHNHQQFWLDGYPSPAAVQLVPGELQQALKKWKNINLQQCWHYFPMSLVIFCSVWRKYTFTVGSEQASLMTVLQSIPLFLWTH